jgi:hypothetical protein
MSVLWAAACPWNPIPLNSRYTIMVLAGQFVALKNSQVILSLDIWQISQTTFFNARWSLLVIKRGLPSCGCALTFPLHNHVTSRRLWQLEKGCSVPDRSVTDVATNN